MHGNSLIPTQAEHDRHHAHVCAECAAEFDRHNRPAGETAEGDLCADCWETHIKHQQENQLDP